MCDMSIPDQFFAEFEDLMRKYEVERVTLHNVVFSDEIWLNEYRNSEGCLPEKRENQEWLRG